MPDQHLLGPLGLGENESALYLYLLSTPRCTAHQLVEATGLTVSRVRRSLTRLTEAGLVTRLAVTPARYVTAPPETAVDSLARKRQEELEQVRAQIREVARKHQGASVGTPDDLLELIEGNAQITHRVQQLQLGTQEELLVVDCPPYFDMTAQHANPIALQLLRRGVSVRVIYHQPSLEFWVQAATECIAAGEQARVLPSVHMKMAVADRSAAMIPLNFGASETTAALYLHPSPLLTTLINCFEMLWERATPLVPSEVAQQELTEQDRKLLQMLASGMKDAAITRALGVTQRTTTRRIAHLMSVLGAQTRFQTGLQASRRGWL